MSGIHVHNSAAAVSFERVGKLGTAAVRPQADRLVE